MEQKLVKIGAAAELIGTSLGQLRKWESTGKILPARKTRGGTYYYAVADLLGLANEAALTICYAGVSSHDQKADLDRQHAALEAYGAAKGWRTEIIREPGIWDELPQERLAVAAGADPAAADEAAGVDAQRPAAPVRRGTGIHAL